MNSSQSRNSSSLESTDASKKRHSHRGRRSRGKGRGKSPKLFADIMDEGSDDIALRKPRHEINIGSFTQPKSWKKIGPTTKKSEMTPNSDASLDLSMFSSSSSEELFVFDEGFSSPTTFSHTPELPVVFDCILSNLLGTLVS